MFNIKKKEEEEEEKERKWERDQSSILNYLKHWYYTLEY